MLSHNITKYRTRGAHHNTHNVHTTEFSKIVRYHKLHDIQMVKVKQTRADRLKSKMARSNWPQMGPI